MYASMRCPSLIIFCYLVLKCDCSSVALFLQPVNEKRNSNCLNMINDHQGTAQIISVGTDDDYVTRFATSKDVLSIVSCTNDAYVADAFFKKAEYHDRFTDTDVMEMISSPNTAFIVATRCSDPDKSICGSLYLQWESKLAESKVGGPKIIGKFSAVAVSRSSQRKGVGHLLIQSAEKTVIKIANGEMYQISNVSEISGNDKESTVSAEITMGVINVREDLFPWYQAQGFTIEEQMPWDAELSRIVSESYEHVSLIRMRKTLM
jgi:ribosomal protein S18 acetylase RimI-like enzyme